MEDWLFDGSNPGSSVTDIMLPINNKMQTCYATSYIGLERLSTFLTETTLIQTINTFFKDINNLVTSIKLFPFKLSISNSDDLYLQIAGTDVADHSGNPCPIGVIDVKKYAKPYRLFKTKVLPMDGVEPHYYDYNGYTKLFLFLPFYGEVEILANDVMNKYLAVNYCVSVITGDLIYYITVSDLENMPNHLSRIIGKYTTNIAIDIPVGSSNQHEINRNLILSAANAAITVGTTAATIAGAIPSHVSSKSSYTTRSLHEVSKKRRLSKDARLKTTGTRDLEDTKEGVTKGASYTPTSRLILNGCEEVAAKTISTLNNAMLAVSSEIPKSAFLDQFGPHNVKLVIYRPRLLNDNHAKYVGLPLSVEGYIGEYTGATKMTTVKVGSFNSAEANPTLAEIEEIKDILLSGFYNEF